MTRPRGRTIAGILAPERTSPRTSLVFELDGTLNGGNPSHQMRLELAPRSFRSLHAERERVLGAVPLKPEHAPAVALRIDPDGKHLDRLRQLVGSEIEPRQVLGRVVFGAPLSGLRVDNQFGATR